MADNQTMTKVQHVSDGAPSVEAEAWEELSAHWVGFVSGLSTLQRRSTFAGLLQPHPGDLDREKHVLFALRQMNEIGANMQRRGLPTGPSWSLLVLKPEWQKFLATPSASFGDVLPWLNVVADDVADAVHQMNDHIEMSPQPDGEWGPVINTLGDEVLASLIGTSVSSVRRYSAGMRETPQDVAERLHFVALVLADLAGSYNDYGMRRWFSRPRSALGGRSPGQLLGKFDIDGEDARAVAGLAAALTGAGAA